MAQPLFCRIALILNFLLEGYGWVSTLLNPDDILPQLIGKNMQAGYFLQQGMAMVFFTCFGAFAAGVTGGGPSTAAPALIGATVYHVGTGLFLHRAGEKAGGAAGSEQMFFAKLHAAFAVISFVGILVAHFARQGGILPKGKRS